MGATVLSSSWLDAANCATGQLNRTDFGSVTPGTSVVTSLDCELPFGSSNDTAMLRIGQRDRGGVAMTAMPTAGVLAHWPLNGSLSDIAGTDQPMNFEASTWDPSFVASQAAYGQAVNFDGTDRMYANDDPTLDQTGDFSISMWFRSPGNSASSWNGMAYKTTNNGCGWSYCNYGIEWGSNGTPTVADDDLLFGVADAGFGAMRFLYVNDIGTTYLDNNWHHVAMTVDVGGMMRGYLDGVEVGTALPVTGPLLPNAGPLDVGSDANHVYRFVGDIDELIITSTVRSAGDIRAEYLGRIADYDDAGGDDWATASRGLFGVCLRDVADGALTDTPYTTWVEAPATTCSATDGTHWRSIPTSMTKIAQTIAPDAQGGATDPIARLRFGLRVKADQVTGAYSAPVDFEVIAPAT